MIRKTFTQTAHKILNAPAGKAIILSDGYRLWVDGDHPMEATTFVLATPLGVATRMANALWLPEGQSIELPPESDSCLPTNSCSGMRPPYARFTTGTR